MKNDIIWTKKLTAYLFNTYRQKKLLQEKHCYRNICSAYSLFLHDFCFKNQSYRKNIETGIKRHRVYKHVFQNIDENIFDCFFLLNLSHMMRFKAMLKVNYTTLSTTC